MANFILISGPPGSGKTTITSRIQETADFPSFSKDELKCELADSLKTTDKYNKQSQELGLTAINLLRTIIINLSSETETYLIESTFMPKYDNLFFQELISPKSSVCQIYLYASTNTLIKRIEKRALSGERHPPAIKTNQD